MHDGLLFAVFTSHTATNFFFSIIYHVKSTIFQIKLSMIVLNGVLNYVWHLYEPDSIRIK